jgi:flavin reductase (DIM6/NTAB) family NADH-FMN oxidoreductase RutF
VDVGSQFNAIVGNLEYPMYIVTARAGDERLGCLVGFATQTSIDPQRFLVCVSRANHTYRRGRDAELLGVHVVPDDAAQLAELFGGETGDDTDKFARCVWHDGPGGVPLLDACESWFVGRIVGRMDAGDHEAFLLDPIAANGGSQEPFTFGAAKRIDPGHAP